MNQGRETWSEGEQRRNEKDEEERKGIVWKEDAKEDET